MAYVFPRDRVLSEKRRPYYFVFAFAIHMCETSFALLILLSAEIDFESWRVDTLLIYDSLPSDSEIESFATSRSDVQFNTTSN
jgi:hypothetical protein